MVEEVSGAPRLISHRVDYPVVGLREPFAFGESLGIVDSFGRLIVEALRTESPFYRALCYYNVARYFYKLMDGKLRRIRNLRGLAQPPRRILPEDHPFTTLAPGLVGRRYVDLLDEVFRKHYRNPIAHFAVGATLRPVDVTAEQSTSVASLVLKKMAFDAVTDVRRDLECLFADGWDPSSLEAMIAAIDDEELKGAGVYASSKAATE